MQPAGEGVTDRPMVDSSDFEKLRESLKAYDATREDMIKKTRDVQRLSKQAIFSLHRGRDDEAQQRLEQADTHARALLPIVEREPTLRPGGFANAMEEMAEARIFRGFLLERRLLTSDEVAPANTEEYLGGVLDAMGELNRYAVSRATARDVAAVKECRDLVEEVFGQMLLFDLRNGSLRKKYDTLKWTLKSLENLLYELSLRGEVKMRNPGDEEPVVGGGDGADD